MSSLAPQQAVDVTFKVDSGYILVYSLFKHKDRCKGVDGGRWNPDMKCWEYPADPETANELREAFRGVGKAVADAEFRKMLAPVTESVAAPAGKEWDGPDPLTSLWSHQQEAVAKALPHTGYYLAHDMGAGKTLSAIALMLKRRSDPVLVLCPKRVITSWRDQLERHAGSQVIAVPLVKGTVAKRVDLAAQAVSDYSNVVIIANYEAAVQPAFREWALKQKWGLIICDESHRLKSPGGVISKFVSTLGKRAQYRLCLSGTPFAHGPLDIYGQFRFLAPEIFGTSYAKFRNRYAILNPSFQSQVVDYINMDELNEKFYSRADRVMTRDVVDLPDERDEILYGTLSETAQKSYDELVTFLQTEIDSAPDEPGLVIINNILVQIIRLQQITGGYVRDVDGVDHEIDTTKADLLRDFLEDIPVDEPLVLFARFSHDLDAIRRVVALAGRTHGEISGRHDDYAKWQAGDINTIAVQLQAGGEGLNDLVRARYCIYWSVDHSLKNYVQSRGRIIRPGQKQNVVFYHLVCRDTIDEAIYRALSKRQEVVTNLLKERHL